MVVVVGRRFTEGNRINWEYWLSRGFEKSVNTQLCTGRV